MVGSTGEEDPRAPSRSMMTRLFLWEDRNVNLDRAGVDMKRGKGIMWQGNGRGCD
jgi:hypothetical protein